MLKDEAEERVCSSCGWGGRRSVEQISFDFLKEKKC